MMTTDHIANERPVPRRLEQWQPDVAAVRSTVADLEQQTRTFIRHWPVVAVLAALGAGYGVARLVSRGMR